LRLSPPQTATAVLLASIAAAFTPTADGAADPPSDAPISVVTRVAVLDSADANSVLRTATTLPIHRIEFDFGPGYLPLTAAELPFAEALGIEKALKRLPRSQVIFAKTLTISLNDREAVLVSFQRDPESEPDEWFLKLAIRPLFIRPKHSAALTVEAEAVRFSGDAQSVAAADLVGLGIGKTLLSVLQLPSPGDPGRTILILLRPESPRGDSLSPAQKQKQDIEAGVLSSPVDLNLKDAPLTEALAALRDAAAGKLNIAVDPTLPIETPLHAVTLAAQRMPVGKALERMLTPLELAYELDGNLVFITSPAKLDDLIVRTYPEVMQLTFEAHNVDPAWEDRLRLPSRTGDGRELDLYRFTPPLLMEYICEHVAPQSWKENGGKAFMDYSDALGVLIVRQTIDNHSKLAALLRDLTHAHESNASPSPVPQAENQAH